MTEKGGGLRTLDEITAEWRTSGERAEDAATACARAALEGVAVLMAAAEPAAVLLHVDFSDQTMSGALVSREWQDSEGCVHSFAPEHDDLVFDQLDPFLYDLDDTNREVWEQYLVDGVSRRNGPSPLDLVRLTEALTTRSHPEWPANPGVDVGCEDRGCATCYVQ